MTVLEKCIERCRKKPKRIIFGDARDERVLKAARRLRDEHLARPLLIGGPVDLREFAAGCGLKTQGLSIRWPLHDPDFEKYVKELLARRGPKGLSRTQAEELLCQPLWYSAAALRNGRADISIAGNLSSTADVLRAGIQALGLAGRDELVSSFYLMQSSDGSRLLAFADCSVVPRPSAEQLALIARRTAAAFSRISGEAARLALLSFSTRGSARHERVEVVRQAVEILKKAALDFEFDGELQFDSALVPDVARKKAPDSPLRGTANVLIFPSLNAGNIGYKIAERIAGFQAMGPFLQGLAGSYHDLSRGCSVDDIVRTAVIASCLE